MTDELNIMIRGIIVDTLRNSAPGVSETIRQAIANSLMLKLRDKIKPVPSTAITHADLCILSRIYNDRESPVQHGTHFRINEWLKAQIAAACEPTSSTLPSTSE